MGRRAGAVGSTAGLQPGVRLVREWTQPIRSLFPGESAADLILIEVPRSACRSLDFHRAAEVIEVGHELAARALDILEKPATPALDQ